MRPVPVWSVVVTAAATALLVWVLAVPVAGVELVVPGQSGGPATTVGPAAVAIVAALVTLAAWPVRALFRRFASRPVTDPVRAHASGPGTAPNRRIVRAGRPVGWWAVCAAVFAVALVGPAGADSAAAGATLVALHVVVGAVVVVGLDPRRSR